MNWPVKVKRLAFHIPANFDLHVDVNSAAPCGSDIPFFFLVQTVGSARNLKQSGRTCRSDHIVHLGWCLVSIRAGALLLLSFLGGPVLEVPIHDHRV